MKLSSRFMEFIGFCLNDKYIPRFHGGDVLLTIPYLYSSIMDNIEVDLNLHLVVAMTLHSALDFLFCRLCCPVTNVVRL